MKNIGWAIWENKLTVKVSLSVYFRRVCCQFLSQESAHKEEMRDYTTASEIDFDEKDLKLSRARKSYFDTLQHNKTNVQLS